MCVRDVFPGIQYPSPGRHLDFCCTNVQFAYNVARAGTVDG